MWQSWASSCLAGGSSWVLSYLRFAVGAFVLAASLLISSAAVADADSSDSAAPGPGGANASIQGSTTASRPVGDVTDTLRTKIQRVMRTLGSVRQSGQQPYPGAEKPNIGSGGTDIKEPQMGRKTARASVPRFLIRSPRFRTRSRRFLIRSPRFRTRSTVLIRSPRFRTRSHQFLIRSTPLSVAVAPVPSVVGPVSNVSASVVPLAQLPSDLYSFLLGIAGVAPVSDVSALVQDMLTSVAGAVVPLAQLPSDLFSLLGIAGVQPVVGEVAGIHGRGLSGAAGASVGSRLPLGPPLAGYLGAATRRCLGPADDRGNRRGCHARCDRARSRVSGSRMAPPEPDAAFPIRAGSSFRHVVGAIVLSVSLWALAAAALPGAGGLGFLTLAGVRVGYRQAKAGFALRTTGIAHFARPGAVSLGVVRSGSLVVIRPRALRVDRPQALTAEQLLDKVA